MRRGAVLYFLYRSMTLYFLLLSNKMNKNTAAGCVEREKQGGGGQV